MKNEMVIASTNESKIAELQCIVKSYPSITLYSPQDIISRFGLSPVPVVDEPEQTYFGNALRKAEAFAAWSRFPALADDSGLEVDFLGGRPGVQSARYGGPGISDRQRCELLLAEIREKGGFTGEKLTARFRCCLVYLNPETGFSRYADIALEGEVQDSLSGDFGFGYDPIIKIDSLGHTLAELPFEALCRQGFRAIALPQLFENMGVKEPTHSELNPPQV